MYFSFALNKYRLLSVKSGEQTRKNQIINSHGAPKVLYLKLGQIKDRRGTRDHIKYSKKKIGVNRCKIENIDIEAEAGAEQLVINARPYKCDRCHCGICGRKAPKYDKGKGVRRWRPLDIGNSMPVYVESESPRVECPEHGVVVCQVPWARHGSGFTKNMEDSAVWLSLYMNRKAVSEYLRVKCETVGSIIGRVDKELSSGTDRFDDLVNIGIDETSYKKGHHSFAMLGRGRYRYT